jgi:site-specific DNA-methyltransferase (adenine-specific)
MEIYKSGKITLINGDCMDYMRDLPDKAFDLAIVDPPYNLARFKNGIGKNDRHTVKTKKSAIWNNNAPTDEYWEYLFRASKNQIVWGANNFIMPPSEYFCVWNKKQTVDNFASAEYAWVSMGLKSPAKIFEYSIHQHNSDGGKIHPTQKPVKLYQWLLANYAKPGQRILDTHLGSGSSAIAAHYAGHEFVGVELDADYYYASVERFQRETAQIDIFGGL